MQTKLYVTKSITKGNKYDVVIVIEDMNIKVQTTTTKAMIDKTKLPVDIRKGGNRFHMYEHLNDLLTSINYTSLYHRIAELLLHAVLEFLALKWGKL